MHLTKYFQKYRTPTCFGTEVPSSGSYSDKGVEDQHDYVGIMATQYLVKQAALIFLC